MEIQAWYLYSHTAYLSRIMSINFQLCLFVLSSAQTMVQWLTVFKVKTKNNRSLPPSLQRTPTGKKNILSCLWARWSIKTEWHFYSLLFIMKVSRRYRSVILPCSSLDHNYQGSLPIYNATACSYQSSTKKNWAPVTAFKHTPRELPMITEANRINSHLISSEY